MLTCSLSCVSYKLRGIFLSREEMPINVKDYTWDQNFNELFITVPLKGVNKNKVDIFTCEEYVKVNYPPFFFECLLYDKIRDEISTATIADGIIVLKLVKRQSEEWPQLLHPDADCKATLLQRKEAAIAKHQERLARLQQEAVEEKRTREKYALRQQMDLEDAERKRVTDIKESEKEKAVRELEAFKEEQQRIAKEELEQQVLQKKMENEEKQKAEEKKKNAENTVNGSQEKRRYRKKRGAKEIFHAEAGDAIVRDPGRIAVSFTPRVFPTAARESTADKEDEWLKKQAEYRRRAAINDADLTEEEKDPVWLRDKGISLFKAGNYEGAISAYSHGIRMNFKMPALYSNRAACHLKLGNFMKCIEDCQRALELLTPPVPQNAANRVRAHVRRGTAFCQLELYAEGLLDYEAALKIDPSNEELKEDALRIRTIIQGEQPA